MSAPFEHRVTAVKIMICGGFGAGKTTLVGAASEIDPLSTEAAMTEVSVGVDDLSGVDGKSTTTVALDFGRITLDDRLVLYLFGTPGQDRFAFLWDDLMDGALGAVVLVDVRRVEESFPSVDYLEERDIPFVLAVNHFDGARRFELGEVGESLGIGPETPVVDCDARSRDSVKQVLLALVELVLVRRMAFAGMAARNG